MAEKDGTFLVTEAGRMQLRDEFQERVCRTVQRHIVDDWSVENMRRRTDALTREQLRDLVEVLLLQKKQLAEDVLKQK